MIRSRIINQIWALTLGKNHFWSSLLAESCHARSNLVKLALHWPSVIFYDTVMNCNSILSSNTTMPSSKEDGTATAAEQVGSMSLGESVERKDNETESDEDTEENGTPTKLCSACGKKSDTLKMCTACKCVWYCDKDCQKRHHREHRRECKLIKTILDNRNGVLTLGTEKDIGPLGKVPPREECPICMHVMPIHESLSTYAACCGKTLCCACDLQHEIKNGEGADTCPFCRTELPETDDEMLAQLRKRVELKDPEALRKMAMHCGIGRLGLPVDQAKCIELMRQAADLGDPIAQCQLGICHHDGKMGAEQNKEEALKYWEKAAEGGHLIAGYNLGCIKNKNGDQVAAMRHWRVSASGGSKRSMEALIKRFEAGFLQHQDLAETMRAFYRSGVEMKSRERDQYIEHLKTTGEYNAEYDF